MIGYIAIFSLTMSLFLMGCKVLTVPTYKGPESDHFDGKKFHMPTGNEMGDFKELMSYQIKNKKARWPYLPMEPTFTETIVDRAGDEIRFLHINHATVLLQHYGVNIITDPVFSKRASPWDLVGPKRHRGPAISIDQLPTLDIILISHDHYDHLDIKSLKKIQSNHSCKIIVGLGLKAYLNRFGIENVIEVDWDQCIDLGQGLKITFLPAKHWSNRGWSPYKTLWGSYMIESPIKKIYFAGDSGFGPHFDNIKSNHPTIDLALIPIGAYIPRSFMKYVHLDPIEAVKAHQVLNPIQSLGIHWGTFQLTGEGMFDPADLLEEECVRLGIDNFTVDRHHTIYYFIE